MTTDSARIQSVIRILSKTNAFSRLRRVTFLGILSPNFWALKHSPFRKNKPHSINKPCDTNRAEHSVSVARIAYNICDQLELSEETKLYAIVWGMTHDISTWPLSHTGEAAFSEATGVTGKQLRKDIILGNRSTVSSFSLYGTLKQCGVDPGKLVALFEKSAEFDSDLRVLHSIIHSPLTPDALDGMYRTGKIYGVETPSPIVISNLFVRDMLSGVRFGGHDSKHIINFWNAKSKIYDNHINKVQTIHFESAWSQEIKEKYNGISIFDSLLVTEGDLLNSISEPNTLSHNSILRYKPPLSYKLSSEYLGKRRLRDFVSIGALQEILVKNVKAL